MVSSFKFHLRDAGRFCAQRRIHFHKAVVKQIFFSTYADFDKAGTQSDRSTPFVRPAHGTPDPKIANWFLGTTSFSTQSFRRRRGSLPLGIGNLPKYVQDEADLIIILRPCKQARYVV
jgi:hypothetical protein